MSLYIVKNPYKGFVVFDDVKNANAKIDAESYLVETQNEVLQKESNRFSISVEINDGVNSIWREMQDSDGDEYIYNVFDTFSGQYIKCDSKEDALNVNENLKKQFISYAGVDRVYLGSEFSDGELNLILNGLQSL